MAAGEYDRVRGSVRTVIVAAEIIIYQAGAVIKCACECYSRGKLLVSSTIPDEFFFV